MVQFVFGGAGFHHLYQKQSHQQIEYFMRHWRKSSEVGQMLECTLAWAQLNVGVSFPILEYTSLDLPHLESKWIASIRVYLASIRAGLQLDRSGLPALQRQGDSFIMDYELDSKKLKIRRINYCRLYLQAITIADLASPDGEVLDNCKLNGTMSLQSSRTRWLHINQDKPSQKEWQLWKRVNLLWSFPDGRLKIPLKAWTHPKQTLRHQYMAYKRGNRIWVRGINNKYTEYLVHLRTKETRKEIRKEVSFEHISAEATPVEVRSTLGNTWKLHGTHWSLKPQDTYPLSAAATFNTFIESLPAWEKDILQHITMFVDPFTVSVETQRGFRAVSDGSANPPFQASYGWMMSTRSGERAVQGMGPVRGRVLHSYRAEATGLLSVLRFLIRLREFTFMHEQWEGIVATDSESLLNTLSGGAMKHLRQDAPLDLDFNQVILDVLIPEWDILIEIQKSIKLLPRVRLEYTPGHQDRLRLYETLPLLGQLNADADRIASEYQEEFSSRTPFTLMSPNTRAHLVFSDGTVTSRFAEALELESSGEPLKDYLRMRNNWTMFEFDTINWNAHGSALKRFKNRRPHFVKFVHYLLPTARFLNKFDGGQRCCILCKSCEEDRDHIMRCPHPSREQWRRACIQKITEYCLEKQTYPQLTRALTSGLEDWFNGIDVCSLDNSSFPLDLHEVIRKQSKIGWHHLMLGRFVSDWLRIQGRYMARVLNNTSKRDDKPTYYQTPEQWQVGLIKVLWDHWSTLWDSRNKEVHGHDARTRTSAEQEAIRHQLQMLYLNRHLMDPKAESLLLTNAESHDAHSILVRKNWLRMNTPIFTESVRRVKRMALRGVQSIHSYFLTKPYLTTGMVEWYRVLYA